MTNNIITRMQAEIDAANIALNERDAEITRLKAVIANRHAELGGAYMAMAHEVAAAGPRSASVQATAKQLAAQLDDSKPWARAEQDAFAVFLAQFPDESSRGIMSLGDAWKAGRAYEVATPPASPAAPADLLKRLRQYVSEDTSPYFCTNVPKDDLVAAAHEIERLSAAAPQLGVPQGFIDYVQANYSGVIDIHSPEWHAKRLWKAAMFNLNAAAPDAPAAPDVQPVAIAARDDLEQAVSDFRKATYEFARGHDSDDHDLMMQAQVRIFAAADAMAAAQPVTERTCYLDANGATRCSGCQANHDLNQDHDEDCWVGAAEGGAAQPAAAGAQDDAETARRKRLIFTLSQCIHNLVVGNQSAWIEWRHGNGAEAAMQWIENGLAGPGHIPDVKDGASAQAYFDANVDERMEPAAPAATQGAETPKDGGVMSDAEKAVAACAAYAKAHAEVKRLTGVIGEALNSCATVHLDKYADWNTDGGEYPPVWESHLKEAYRFDEVEETQYTGGERVYMEPDEQEEYLAEKCPHCLAAHHAIQQRKTARKAFGTAKRYVGSIGRANSSGEVAALNVPKRSGATKEGGEA